MLFLTDFLFSTFLSLYLYQFAHLSSSGEVKTLMLQLLRGVAHMHDNWIIHRDLKTSNLLLSHKGILKVSLAHIIRVSVDRYY